METKTSKLKRILTKDGSTHLYELWQSMVNTGNMKIYADKYLDIIKEYNALVSGEKVGVPRIFLVYGDKDKLDKFLVLFLCTRIDKQDLKYFGVEDLNLVQKPKDDILSSNELPYRDYPNLAITNIHKHVSTYGKMEEWMNSSIIQQVTTRQRSRKPTIVMSEKPIPESFRDFESFIYIDLYNHKVIDTEVHTTDTTQKQDKQDVSQVNTTSSANAVFGI